MTANDIASKPELLLLSAITQAALEQQTVSLRKRLLSGDTTLQDIAGALRISCKDAPHRRVLVCTDRDDALAALAEERSNRVLTGHVEDGLRPTVLLLPGVGDQYVGMGHGLYTTRAVFREEVDRCAYLLEDSLGCDIRKILYPPSEAWKSAASTPGIDLKRMLGKTAAEPQDPDTARLNTTLFAQPALFTIEYAMSRLWLSLGLAPQAIVGHSMGEYVAACLSGVFSLQDALRLIVTRARLVDALPEAVMLAVMLPESELRPLLPTTLEVSLINGPSHCVVAGTPEAAAAFEETLTARGVIFRRVQNGHAFHTSQMESIAGQFLPELRKVRFRQPTIRYISNVTGDWITAAQAMDPEYWLMHACRTARFSDALHRLWQLENPILVECGPARTLSVLAVQHPDRKGTLQGAIWSIRQRYENEPDEQLLQKAIGKIWLAGGPVLRSRIDRDGPHGPARRAADAQEELSSALPSASHEPARQEPAPFEELPVTALKRSDEPANDRERQLLEVWRTALGREHIGVNDSFGALGGDSLSSIGAIMEMQRVGVPDEVARGLYRGLTIRQMASQEWNGRTAAASAGPKLASVETAVLVRSIAIYIVVAQHFGLTEMIGNTSLMIVSGLSFAKFQLRAVERAQNIRPVFHLMLRLAIPVFLYTVIHQAVHGVLQLKSWLFIDNWLDPFPVKKFESPYFIDLLLQVWLLAGLPLAIMGVRRFAVRNTYAYAIVFLAIAWLASVIIPLIWDPRRIWHAVPYMYVWMFAIGWCAAYSATNRQRVITSVALIALNLLDDYCQIGAPIAWYVVVAGLAITWYEEIPARLPRPLVRILVGAAAASLFIYLTHFQFVSLLKIAFAPFGKVPPAWLSIAVGMLGGYLVWKGWNLIQQFAMVGLRKLGAGWADLRLRESDA